MINAPARQSRPDRFATQDKFAPVFFAFNGNMQAIYNHFGTNSSLTRETWELVNRSIIAELQRPLIGLDDLESRAGLVRPIGINNVVFIDNIASDLAPASQSVDIMAEQNFDAQDFRELGITVPVQYKDYRADMRFLANVLPDGSRPDTSWASVATRKVNELRHSNLFNGAANIAAADAFGNLHPMYGYMTHPSIQVVTSLTPWTTFNIVGADISAILQNLEDNFWMPSFMMYVSGNVSQILNQIRSEASTVATWRQLILQDERLLNIRRTFELADGEVILVALEPDVIQLVQAMTPQPFEWDAMGALGTDIRILSIEAPFIKRMYSGKVGIIRLTGVTG